MSSKGAFKGLVNPEFHFHLDVKNVNASVGSHTSANMNPNIQTVAGEKIIKLKDSFKELSEAFHTLIDALK
ncbi:MAG: hypothetical protein HQK91_05745 [Nitrospirae bacterium]|nr:hypothetical protein [Nitrospirota bacterium]